MRREFYGEENKETLERCKFIIESLCNYMSQCAEIYANLFNIPKNHLDFAISILKQNGTTIGINKYNENTHMGPHVDLNNRNQYIQYTIVVYLNDNYEGGELHFPNHDITVKPIAGSIAMYPSGHPYTHESINITKGRKMLITHHLRNNNAR
jgi:predicted 2-oxoglutarate/Fe(II)-dependent dioxygenase YbiX